MDILDFLPFNTELRKAYQGFTHNASKTSEHPAFDELRIRRFARPRDEVAAFIIKKILHWVGWNLRSKKTSVGGMVMIRAEVFSFALFGTKIDVSFGLSEEIDRNGKPITTVNSKAETEINARGDLGESRRVIRMVLAALDFEFRASRVKEHEYQLRSVDPESQQRNLQALFESTEQQEKPAEEKKKPVKKQIIQFSSKAKTNGSTVKEAPNTLEKTSGAPVSEEKTAAPATAPKAKIKVIKLKK